MDYSKFIQIVKSIETIRCNRWNILNGKGLYHVVGVHDEEVVVLKKYSYKRKAWLYILEYLYGLWLYYENGWLEMKES